MAELGEALAIFEAALAAGIELRAALLDERCAGDPELRAAVEALLAADAETSVLDTGAAGVPGVVAAAVDDLLVPARLGPFEIIRELGRGGMGVVYEAQQHEPTRRIALKTLPLVASAAARAQFRVEVQALASLLHPNIPQVYELFEHDGRPVLAMELVRGRPLREVAERLPLRGRVELLVEIAAAVEHAHAHGIIHRDLKPSNVLVDADGRPKLLDFGIASFDGSGLERAGTLAYMPPEQLRGAAIEPRVDVYALAAMAWELLTGAPPIALEGRSNAELLAAKDAGPPTDVELPATLAASLRRGLAAAPGERFASVTELRAAWQAFLDDDARRTIDSRQLTGVALLFMLASVFTATLFVRDLEPGYGVFAASSLILLALGLAVSWRLRDRIAAAGIGFGQATIVLVPLIMSCVVDLGAWLRGWPPVQAHAVILPLITATALTVTLAFERRAWPFALVHAGLWLLSSLGPPDAIYLWLAVSAGTSAIVALTLARLIRRDEPTAHQSREIHSGQGR